MTASWSHAMTSVNVLSPLGVIGSRLQRAHIKQCGITAKQVVMSAILWEENRMRPLWSMTQWQRESCISAVQKLHCAGWEGYRDERDAHSSPRIWSEYNMMMCSGVTHFLWCAIFLWCEFSSLLWNWCSSWCCGAKLAVLQPTAFQCFIFHTSSFHMKIWVRPNYLTCGRFLSDDFTCCCRVCLFDSPMHHGSTCVRMSSVVLSGPRIKM